MLKNFRTYQLAVTLYRQICAMQLPAELRDQARSGAQFNPHSFLVSSKRSVRKRLSAARPISEYFIKTMEEISKEKKSSKNLRVNSEKGSFRCPFPKTF